MRRVSIAVAVSLLVGVLAAPARAGEHVDVQDDVFQGHRLKITVTECVSGADWQAFIRISIVSVRTAERLFRDAFPTSGNGLDVIKIRIGAARFPRGLYKAVVECRHQFAEDDVRLFFHTVEGFRVLEPD